MTETADGKKVYKDLLLPVRSRDIFRRKPTFVPAIFAVLAGPVTRTKIQLANKAIVDWQIRMRKERLGKNKCPWHQPSTQCVEYRSFLARMRNSHDWGFSEKHFAGFVGSVKSILDDLFTKREEVWVSVSNFTTSIMSHQVIQF